MIKPMNNIFSINRKLSILFFLLVSFPYLDAHGGSAGKDWQQDLYRIDTLFEAYSEQVLTGERSKMESILPKDKLETYMAYFDKGMRSNTGVIMIEGSENIWLEKAYLSGYQQKVLFRNGYFKGVLGATGNNQQGPTDHRTYKGAKIPVEWTTRKPPLQKNALLISEGDSFDKAIELLGIPFQDSGKDSLIWHYQLDDDSYIQLIGTEKIEKIIRYTNDDIK